MEQWRDERGRDGRMRQRLQPARFELGEKLLLGMTIVN